MEIIAKILFCLIAAAFLGFVIGWIFASLFKNEKLEAKLTALHDQIDNEKETINQLQNDYEAKSRELELCEERFRESQRELLSLQMDQEQNETLEKLKDKNALLQERLGEQTLLEQENTTLKEELRTLEAEKEKLLQKLSDLEKEDLSLTRESLERANRENELLSEEIASLKEELSSKTALLTEIEQELVKTKEEVERLDQTLSGRLPLTSKKKKSQKKRKKRDKEKAISPLLPTKEEDLCKEDEPKRGYGFEKTDLTHLIRETFQKVSSPKES